MCIFYDIRECILCSKTCIGDILRGELIKIVIRLGATYQSIKLLGFTKFIMEMFFMQKKKIKY